MRAHEEKSFVFSNHVEKFHSCIQIFKPFGFGLNELRMQLLKTKIKTAENNPNTQGC